MISYARGNLTISTTVERAAADLIKHGSIRLDKKNSTQAHTIGKLAGEMAVGCVTYTPHYPDGDETLTWTSHEEKESGLSLEDHAAARAMGYDAGEN